MSTDSFLVSTWFPVSPEKLYAAWLDSEAHAAFTGAGAEIEPRVGGRHTAWDGYIEGETLELVPHSLIVQSWRTTEFPEEAPHSRIEVHFDPENDGTRLVIRHSEIPAGQGESYESGWVESYFTPMHAVFGEEPKPAVKKKSSAKKKKAAPAKKRVAAKKAPAKKKVAAKKKAAPAKKKAAPAKKKPAAKKAPAKKKPARR